MLWRCLVMSICFLIPFGLLSQVSSYVVKLNSKESASYFQEYLNKQVPSDFIELNSIFPDLDLYSLKINTDLSKSEYLPIIESFEDLNYLHKDAEITYRKAPNDTRYFDQTNLALIDAEKVWDLTTGGNTQNQEEIVIAIIDDGFDDTHIDLIDNLWINPGELLDGIDNDQNGFIDDINGANFLNNDGNHPLRNHGTAVAGIIGAKGNNGEGISGLNWDIKMMLLSEGFNIPDIIRSYNYIYEQRKLYNDSNGIEGALVVATNFSAGIDFAKAEDFPSWCEVYDKLGEVGILSVIAVTNKDVNIDQDGDMPGTCSSPYLITVTDTDTNDSFMQSGTGRINVDLSAPGTGTISSRVNDLTGEFGGTSGAAPHVCGTIGLLYSLDCDKITALLSENPSSLALAMKEAILNSTNSLASLSNITVSGGRLNAYNATQALASFCDPSNEANNSLELIDVYVDSETGSVSISYKTNSNSEHHLSLYDPLGRLLYSQEFMPPFLGLKKIEFDIPKITSGISILVLEGDGEVTSKAIATLFN